MRKIIKFVHKKLGKKTYCALHSVFRTLLLNKIFFKFFLLTEIFYSTPKEDKKYIIFSNLNPSKLVQKIVVERQGKL